MFNPLELDVVSFLGLYALHVLAKTALEILVTKFFEWKGTPLLGSRTNAGPMGYTQFAFTDFLFLFLNSWIEFVFTVHLCLYSVYSGSISLSLNELTVFNSIVAFVALFVIDDIFYAPLHRLMHLPLLYPLIHKHHHRQRFPYRGYWDAANESPFEQFIGLGCVAVAIKLTILSTGLHVSGLLAFFVVYAITAMLNHTPYDVKFLLPFEYSAQAHEMHHRYYTCNYAQNVMLVDKLMGTFQPYKS